MCCKFKYGDLAGAMEAYDAGNAVYMYTLGPHHPMHIIHILILADLYYNSRHLLNCHLLLTMAHELSQASTSENQQLLAYITYNLACVNYSLARTIKDDYSSVSGERLRGFPERAEHLPELVQPR